MASAQVTVIFLTVLLTYSSGDLPEKFDGNIFPMEYLITLDRMTSELQGVIQQIELLNMKVIDKFFLDAYTIFEVEVNEKRQIHQLENMQGILSIEQHFHALQTSECEVQILDTDVANWTLRRIGIRESLSQNPYPPYKYWYKKNDGLHTVAYIFDSGIYEDHPEFEGRASHGFTASRIQKMEGNFDYSGYGTGVAGLIISKTYGVTKHAEVTGVKVTDQYGYGTTEDLLEGIDWVMNDFKSKKDANNYKAVVMISMSLSKNDTVDDAVLRLIDEGLAVVATAGDEGDDACNQSPGHLQEVITVSGTEFYDLFTGFGYGSGPCVTLLAPGVYAESTGTNSTTQLIWARPSVAPAVVTGVILRYMSQVKHKPSPREIQDWLLSTATNDTVDMLNYTTTPNRLIYAPCVLQNDDNDSSSVSVYPIGMVTIFFIAITMLLFTH